MRSGPAAIPRLEWVGVETTDLACSGSRRIDDSGTERTFEGSLVAHYHRNVGHCIPTSVRADAHPINLEQAGKAFSEARQLSENDGGRLWGKLLYGAILLVDPKTRTVVANEPDAHRRK